MSEQEKPPEDKWRHRGATMRCTFCMWFVRKDDRNHPEDTEQVEPGNQVGRCRRHAPELGGWPAVYGSDWCGDHKLDANKIPNGTRVSW